MRTSLTHPLKITEVQAEPGQGRIGVTFCPGKHQPDAMTGGWRRDLDAIRDWGAGAVITLVEKHELSALKVADLGRKVRERHMAWYHLPIKDAAIPSPQVEAQWAKVHEGLRARLRDGFNVLVHCKGGPGRAGTIAARLLIGLGVSPREAVKAVRHARPGAIETRERSQRDRTQRQPPVISLQYPYSIEARSSRSGAQLAPASFVRHQPRVLHDPFDTFAIGLQLRGRSQCLRRASGRNRVQRQGPHTVFCRYGHTLP
jgi:protein-tyrosine phosphatase